ncbi:MAG: hypothetical protein WC998_05975 [Candidatus Paceibacterota bacterium]
MSTNLYRERGVELLDEADNVVFSGTGFLSTRWDGKVHLLGSGIPEVCKMGEVVSCE